MPLADAQRRRRDLKLRDQPLRRQAQDDRRSRPRPPARRPVRGLRRDRRPRHGRADQGRHGRLDRLHRRSAHRSRVPCTLSRHAGFDQIEIQPTHRVHEHASAAIVRARKPATCCDADAQAACCEPEAKSACCNDEHATGLRLSNSLSADSYRSPADSVWRVKATADPSRRCVESARYRFESAARDGHRAVRCAPERHSQAECRCRLNPAANSTRGSLIARDEIPRTSAWLVVANVGVRDAGRSVAVG